MTPEERAVHDRKVAERRAAAPKEKPEPNLWVLWTEKQDALRNDPALAAAEEKRTREAKQRVAAALAEHRALLAWKRRVEAAPAQ